MTTIIAIQTPNDQAIYADSLSDGAGIAIRDNNKTAVIAPSCVMGWCGFRYLGLMAARRLQTLLTIDDAFTKQGYLERLTASSDEVRDFAALLLFQGMIWVMHEEMCPLALPGAFAARGSGAHFAMGALAAGSSPLHALVIASQYDISTGGPFYRLDVSGKLDRFPATME